MKVTLHDVAARANLSIATVSRALNGLPVSRESQARVRRAADELGYVANEAARALRSERTMTMGLIFSDLRNMLGVELLDALSETIEEAGYSLLISTARGDSERYDRLLHRFLERRVDAMFCISPHGLGESLARYTASQTPVLSLFRATGAFAALPSVSPSFSDPGKALAKHLNDLGHTRVAIVRDGASTPPLTALSEILKNKAFTVSQIDLAETGGVSDIVAGVTSKRIRASVVIAPDHTARRILKSDGARDLSVVSITDTGADRVHKENGLAAIAIDPHRMGHAAGAAMLAWLAGSPPREKIRIQVAAYTPRASVKAPARTR